MRVFDDCLRHPSKQRGGGEKSLKAVDEDFCSQSLIAAALN